LLEPAAAQPGSQQETTDLPPQATALVTTSYKTGLEIWESSDPETEVRITAQAIRDLVIGRSKSGSTGIRYRQIGVIVPDLDGYSDAIRRIFAEHAIPHFIDQRRGIAHHPLVELLRSALAIATNRWDRDDMLLYLKTRLAGVSQEDVALIENYLIEHGITHMPWSLPWKWIAPNRSEDDADPDERVAGAGQGLDQRADGLRSSERIDEVAREFRAERARMEQVADLKEDDADDLGRRHEAPARAKEPIGRE